METYLLNFVASVHAREIDDWMRAMLGLEVFQAGLFRTVLPAALIFCLSVWPRRAPVLSLTVTRPFLYGFCVAFLLVPIRTGFLPYDYALIAMHIVLAGTVDLAGVLRKRALAAQAKAEPASLPESLKA